MKIDFAPDKWTFSGGQWSISPDVEIRDIVHRDIYTPAQEPGWVAWPQVWKEPDGTIRVFFAEACGDVYQLPMELDEPESGVGVHELRSTDCGESWEDVGWHARLPGQVPQECYGWWMDPLFVLALRDGRLLATCLGKDPTQSFPKEIFTQYDPAWLGFSPPGVTGRGELQLEEGEMPVQVPHIIQSRDGERWETVAAFDGPAYAGVGRLTSLLELRDGTIIAAGGRGSHGLPHPAPHDTTIIVESTDGGNAWSEPIIVYPTDGATSSEHNVSAETSLVELSDDGHVLLVQRRNSPQAGQGRRITLKLRRRDPGAWDVQEVPNPFGGVRHPAFLRCADGTIWQWDSDGHHYVSLDDGETWQAHRIAPSYYGKLVQANDNRIISITQANIADRPFPHIHDARLRMTRFAYGRSDVLAQNETAGPALATVPSLQVKDSSARVFARVDRWSALAFRIQDEANYYVFAVRILPEEEGAGLQGKDTERRRAMVALGKMENGQFRFLVQREAYGGLAPGTWVQIQVKAEGDRLMGAFLESPDRAATYAQIHDDTFAAGGLGVMTLDSSGAFKQPQIWDEPREIRGNWVDSSVPPHLPESGPGGGLERNRSVFWW